jgi:ribosomal protein S18 acetylase RimI-like enzyme
MDAVVVREVAEADRAWMRALLRERWTGPEVVSRGRVHAADRLPGFVAWSGTERVGLATCAIAERACELVTLDSLRERVGVGTALLDAAAVHARQMQCTRLWLITTNDNTAALRFYQRRGLRLCAVYPDALAQSRRLKPTIPPVGIDGIPLRDEIELELPL